MGMPHFTVEMPRWQYVASLAFCGLLGYAIGHYF